MTDPKSLTTKWKQPPVTVQQPPPMTIGGRIKIRKPLPSTRPTEGSPAKARSSTGRRRSAQPKAAASERYAKNRSGGRRAFVAPSSPKAKRGKK